MVTEKNSKGIKLVSIFIMSLVTVGSLAFAVGNGSSKKLRERLTAVEKLCERWDERWKNLEKWMIRIESKIDEAK